MIVVLWVYKSYLSSKRNIVQSDDVVGFAAAAVVVVVFLFMEAPLL